MTTKNTINLGKVQETLLLPLWGRAMESRKKNSRLNDPKAVEIIEKLEYDFSTITENIIWVSQYAWVARSLHIDRVIRQFLQNNPDPVIVNIGCGLDTTYERNDDGHGLFLDLDLPDVVRLREKFFTDTARRKTIACSFLDTKWFEEVPAHQSMLVIAGGVFYYFTEKEVREFFLELIARFPGTELFFDCASPLGVRVANKKVIRDGGMDESATLKWGIKDPWLIKKWDSRIRVLSFFPMFHGMKKDFSLKGKYTLWLSDTLKIMWMVHLKLN